MKNDKCPICGTDNVDEHEIHDNVTMCHECYSQWPTEGEYPGIQNALKLEKDLAAAQATVLYLQVLLPQLKEQGDVTSVGWIEGALDEGDQPHTSPAAEERLAEIKELVEASDTMDAEEEKDD